MDYVKHINGGKVIGFKASNGSLIPNDPTNSDYAKMLLDIEADPTCSTDQDVTPVPTVDETRITAYGSIGDQLDEIYHDIDAWRVRIAQVKMDNPK